MIKKLNIQIDENIKNAGTENHMEYLPIKPTHRFGEKLVRNIALAGMLIITISAIRNAKLPDGETILTAVQEIIDTPWDESLGKISFVSKMFPEAVSVFFSSIPDAHLIAPCFGAISHPWEENEPYLGYQSADGKVYAVANGQVMSLAHGLNEEKIIRVRHTDGLETLYYNLTDVWVKEGDFVTVNSILGECIENELAVIDVRNDGKSIDPTSLVSPRISNSI